MPSKTFTTCPAFPGVRSSRARVTPYMEPTGTMTMDVRAVMAVSTCHQRLRNGSIAGPTRLFLQMWITCISRGRVPEFRSYNNFDVPLELENKLSEITNH